MCLNISSIQPGRHSSPQMTGKGACQWNDSNTPNSGKQDFPATKQVRQAADDEGSRYPANEEDGLGKAGIHFTPTNQIPLKRWRIHLNHRWTMATHKPFHSQEWSISNSLCSLTRNITSSHSVKNLAFHSSLRWKMIALPILTTSPLYVSLKRLGECTFWTWIRYSARVNKIACRLTEDQVSKAWKLQVKSKTIILNSCVCVIV